MGERRVRVIKEYIQRTHGQRQLGEKIECGCWGLEAVQKINEEKWGQL